VGFSRIKLRQTASCKIKCLQGGWAVRSHKAFSHREAAVGLRFCE
jgi:hypothetical protein